MYLPAHALQASSSPRAASSLSPRGGQQQAARGGAVGAGTLSAPSSPIGSNRGRASSRNKAAGDKHKGGGGGQDDSYTFDYFGLAGKRGAWRGLEGIEAARAEVWNLESSVQIYLLQLRITLFH